MSFRSNRLENQTDHLDTHVRFVLKNRNKTVITRKFDIANDGGNASINNWNVKWKDISAEVIIYVEELYDVLYVLNLDGTDNSKQLDSHYGRTEEEHQQIKANQIDEKQNNKEEYFCT